MKRIHARVFVWTFVSVLVVAAAGMGSSSEASAAGTPHVQPAPGKTQTLEVPTDGGDKSTDAGAINSLGVQEFADVYAGVRSTPDPDGTLVIFVAKDADDTAFVAALANLKSSHQISANYRLATVAHSYADLEQRTVAIAADRSKLQAQGITIGSDGPDIDQNKVEVRLMQTYSASAAASLINQYGGNDWITIPTTQQTTIPQAATRFSDSSPYYGADAIWPAGRSEPDCTDAYMYTGKASGKEYMLTDAHCTPNGPGTAVYTNNVQKYKMGTVGQWEEKDGGFDLATFGISALPYVWADGSDIHPVARLYTAAPGDLVTTDGKTSGEVPDNYVEASGHCYPVQMPDGGPIKDICHMTEITAPAGKTACNRGDSGGPVYQRVAGTAKVRAAGMIEAFAGSTCYYQNLYALMVAVNGNLGTD